MPFGVYIHIPYCLQKCHYCDFITFNLQHPISPPEYVSLLIHEIQQRAPIIPEKNLSSLYFGGGTPSLLRAEDILTLTQALANAGFQFSSDMEATIEINPGTIDDAKLDVYLAAGINRFSVGVQTFKNSYLKNCGREHSAEDSVATLTLLQRRGLNYSFDLLFGLPDQTLDDLNEDLELLLKFSPPHVSLYNLTVPKNHFMNARRAPDDAQAEMMDLIGRRLGSRNILRYEISNYAQRGFESRHNNLYWSDANYWGFGVSAHSYMKNLSPWGTRFWNPSSHSEWKKQVLDPTACAQWPSSLPARQFEHLRQHEALTDFFHTHLRVQQGFSWSKVTDRFGNGLEPLILPRLKKLLQQGYIQERSEQMSLTTLGQKLANIVFLELTFSQEDLSASPH